MNVIDYWTDNQNNVYYSIELEADIVVDIKISADSGAVYAMQNADGSLAHSARSEDTYPNYPFDVSAAERLAAETYQKEYRERTDREGFR